MSVTNLQKIPSAQISLSPSKPVPSKQHLVKTTKMQTSPSKFWNLKNSNDNKPSKNSAPSTTPSSDIITSYERIGSTVSVFSLENLKPFFGFNDFVLFVVPFCLIFISYVPEIFNFVVGILTNSPSINVNLSIESLFNFSQSKDNLILISLKDVFLNYKNYLLFIPFLINIFISMNCVKKESLTIFEKTGVQSERTFYSGKKETIFIPNDRIKQVIMTEAVSMNKIQYHMAFIVTFKKKLILPFSGLTPKFKEVFPIYMKTRAILYGEQYDEKKIEEFMKKHDQI